MSDGFIRAKVDALIHDLPRKLFIGPVPLPVHIIGRGQGKDNQELARVGG